MLNSPCNTPVLIVDDDPVFRDSLRIVLGQVPGEWVVYDVGSVGEAIPLLHNHTVEYAIVDVHLPDGTGADVVRAAGTIPCFLCTIDDEELTFKKMFDDPSVAHNIVGYLVKPLQASAIWNIRAGLQIGRERQAKCRLVASATTQFEDERRIVAQNLHDAIGASLTQLIWVFARIDRAMKAPRVDSVLSAQVADICAQGKKIVADAHTQLSQAVTQLRLEAVDVAGLRTAVEQMMAQWKSTAPNVRFECEITPNLEQVDPHRAGIIYRLVQEGVTNAMRHTSPDRVRVSMTCDDETLCLTVTSHGKILEEKDTYALTVLRERTSALGGILQFSCNLEQEESRLMVTVPI